MKPISRINSSPVLKRLIDIAGAVAGLALGAPVMLAAACCIRLTMGRPLFFRQARAGRDGAVFTVWKFRTMRDGDGPDAERLTAAGSLLRASSIDELPQLWNVLRGEMSLVGPRPLLPHYTEHYTPEQRRRLAVKPGLTGWSQVHGRNALGWEEKFRLDTWYVDHASNALDLLILLETVPAVLTRSGINRPGEATAPMFAPLAGGRQ